MSYSFNLRAANKAAAKQAVQDKIDEIVTNQPVHAHDRAAVLANANAFIDLLEDDNDTRDIAITCSCSVGWNWDQAGEEVPKTLTAGSNGFSAHYCDRVAT